MKKNIFLFLFALIGCNLFAGGFSYAAPSCQSLAKKPILKPSIDTKMQGRNCRNRQVRYSQNNDTKAISAIIECTSCYEGYKLSYPTTTSTETGCEGAYATCVRDGSLILSCTSTTCPGSETDYFFDLLATIDLERSTQLGTKCYKSLSGGEIVSAVERRSCASGYEDYNASFTMPSLNCSASLNTCAPKYNFYCPQECPFTGWTMKGDGSDHSMIKCTPELSYKCETSCETGYYLTRSGCTRCSEGMICKVGEVTKCRSGYYGLTVPGTGNFTCAECPTALAEDGSVVKGKSEEGALAITDCYLPSGKYKTATGKYQLSGNCSYEL